MPKIIVLMGAPGAGKGTQARLLQEHLGLPQISTGDIFRSLKNAETPLAREVRDIMNAGQLVPDELTTRVVRERTSQRDTRDGYILDGYPRTPAQAEALKDLAREQGHQIVAIMIDVPYEQLEKRMTGRRNCPVGGEIFNIYFNPPQRDNVCDAHPDTPLVLRADDNPETVRARLATFDEQTRPLLDYYRRAGILQAVDGTRIPDAIYLDIENLVRNEPVASGGQA
ncbi:MAG TPA: adenylate kinase [Pyrinomonadaceae bacterium]|nr:adenylate kinase [Pyrinomonadaceae bacterium]